MPKIYRLLALSVIFVLNTGFFNLGFIGKQATCSSGVSTFNYTGSTQNFIVPDGCTSITVKMWGAAGAGPYAGGGGFSESPLVVTPGETLTVFVGGSNGYGGGGSGVYGGYTGGGRSAIRRSSTELITAGGGGGSGTRNIRPGGAGGGSSGENGHGQGGTQVSGGGAGGGCSSAPHLGSAFQGGNACVSGSNYGGGGGGGGYYGGGGGASGTGDGTGGGGGSGYVPAAGTTIAGSGGTPGNSGDADRPANIGQGTGTSGHGFVRISY